MNSSGSDVGHEAETSALQYLVSQGLTLVCRNYHCRWGEIDLIMRHAEDLVFVEVRFRRHQSYGGAIESVALAKQRKLTNCALYYLSKVEKCLNTPCRFDVIAMQDGNGSDQDEPHLQWITNAFELCR